MKTTNPIQHQTLALKTLMRSPYHTVGQYTGAIKDTNKIVSRITSYAAHAGARIQTERFTAVNTRTGKTMSVVQAIVLQRGRPKMKPGRKVTVKELCLAGGDEG
jgi:hypothetical protein